MTTIRMLQGLYSRRPLHRIAHFFGVNLGRVDSKVTSGGDVSVFFLCDCGEEQDHARVCFHDVKCAGARRGW